MQHIAVIGAGITGITTASALIDRGYKVTVFDRHRYAAMETSFANGGQLSASNAEVWNQWSTVIKGIKWMFSPGSPLLVNPAPSWHKYSWMAEFVANIPKYRQSTVETVRMAIAAREHLKANAEKHGFDFNCETRGILHFYGNQKEFQHAGEVNKLLAEGGLERRAVTPEEIAQIEPSLNGDFVGGYFTESDFTGDIHAYAKGLAAACVKRGAEIHYGSNVRGINSADGGIDVTWRHAEDEPQKTHFDGVVICAGTQSRQLAAGLGDRVNIYPVKGYSITVKLDDADSQAAAPWVSLLDDHAKIVTSRLGADRLRIAGTAEFNGYNQDIRDDRIKPLVKWCERHFPDVNTEHAVPWAGLRPMMPNMLPRVGPGKLPGVYYNTGHGHLGWTLSAATAELVADAVVRSHNQ
jgi:D-amino-acid dehydrogenase